jgi:hypothetical protein
MTDGDSTSAVGPLVEGEERQKTASSELSMSNECCSQEKDTSSQDCWLAAGYLVAER